MVFGLLNTLSQLSPHLQGHSISIALIINFYPRNFISNLQRDFFIFRQHATYTHMTPWLFTPSICSRSYPKRSKISSECSPQPGAVLAIPAGVRESVTGWVMK